jgi:signal transduction histidine kinase
VTTAPPKPDLTDLAATGPDSATEDRPDFAEFVQAVRRAFDSDALVVLVHDGDQDPGVAGYDGLTPEELAAVAAAIWELIPELSSQAELHVPRLADSHVDGTAKLVSLGYRALVAASLSLDGHPIGALVALRRTQGAIDNAELVGPFASQAALAFAPALRRSSPAGLEERLENLEALDRVALSTQNFDELNATLQACIGALFGASVTGVMVCDDQQAVLQLTPGSFGAQEGTTASYRINASDLHSNAARVFSTGHPYMSNDAAADRGIIQAWVAAFSIRRLLSLQLAVSGRAVGVLHIANKDSDFTVEDLRRAQRLAPRIATAVEFARAMFDLRRKEHLEGVLSWVAVAIASGQSLLDFLPRALGDMCDALDSTLLAIVPQESKPIVHLARSDNGELVQNVLEVAQTSPGARADSVGPQRVGDPGWAVCYRPIHLGTQRIGTLVALRTRGEPFSQSERLALARLGNLGALGWASERYQQQRAELARLQERQRIADDLHDEVAQILFAAHLSLDFVLESERIDPVIAERIVRARGMLVRGDTAIRSVIHHLSQPQTEDLPSRLTALVVGVQDEFFIPVHFEVTEAACETAKHLGRSATDALVKVAREALVNAAKHAGPCRASVLLDMSRAGGVRLRVVDDGVGTTGKSATGHGLASIRRTLETQGGQLLVRRGRAGGTTITAIVPA